MADDEDPISPVAAELITVIVDQIEPDSQLTTELLHYIVSDLMDPPPTMPEVEAILEILRMPHVRYRPGEPSAAVLDRIREMLTRAERPKPTFNPEDFRLPPS